MINSAKEFVLQRICVFASQVFDPNSDSQVVNILKSKIQYTFTAKTFNERVFIFYR